MVTNAKGQPEKPVLVSHHRGKNGDGISSEDNKMRLADFINENTKQIISEWENFARTLKSFKKGDRLTLHGTGLTLNDCHHRLYTSLG